MRVFSFRRWLYLIVLSVLVAGTAACGATPSPLTPTTTPGPTATPAPTRTPSPTSTPTPVPTATPVPPARLGIDWPSRVSPLTPLAVAARWVAPPGVSSSAELSATIVNPEGQVYATFALAERDGDRYAASEMLHLPLEPMPGYWWLIVHVESPLERVGMPVVSFEAEPVPFRDLAPLLPEGAVLRVPLGFEEVVAQGDPVAGGRVWAYGAGEVSVWWAPGPTEELLWNNALVMLEATYAGDDRYMPPATPAEVVPLTWQGRTAFEFAEMWPDPEGGPGRAWVVQGEDFRLYVLRARAVGATTVPGLHMEVAHTFGFAGGLD